MLRSLFLACCCLLALCTTGCQTVRQTPLAFQLEQVSPQHRPAFEALLGALERREHQIAQAVLRQLVPRLEVEASSLDGALAAEAGWQLDAAKRFGQILAGRLRLDALELTLAVEGEVGDQALMLTIRNQWPGPLELEPGSAILEREALFLGAQGQTHSRGGTQVLDERGPWTVPPLGEIRVRLMGYQASALGGAIALRDGFLLHLGAGSVRESEESFPADVWPSSRGMRVNLPNVLPNGSLAPEVLLQALQEAKLGLPALLERTVRIRPEDYDAALRGMTSLLRQATPEIFDRYRPSLGWLCLHRPLPVGLEDWREHLESGHLDQ